LTSIWIEKRRFQPPGCRSRAQIVPDLDSRDPKPTTRKVVRMARGKLNDETERTVTTALAAGNSLKTSAAIAGISESTVGAWLRSERPRHRRFQAAVEKAQGEHEAELVEVMLKARRGSWRAAAFLLERTDPETWEHPVKRRKAEQAAAAEGDGDRVGARLTRGSATWPERSGEAGGRVPDRVAERMGRSGDAEIP
jgi:transposase